MDENETYSVGELSKIAGISVRTLQYYDRCGLLSCAHGEGGRRIYSRDDIVRLQQILFLKSYGFPLKDIKEHLLEVNSGEELARLLIKQKNVILGQIEHLRRVERQLVSLINDVGGCKDIGADKFVATLSKTAEMVQPYAFLLNYLSDSQVCDLVLDKTSETAFERYKRTESELLKLYNEGVDPEGEQGQALADEFWKMAVDISHGSPDMMKSFFSMGIDNANWPDELKELRGAMGEFMSKAMLKYFISNNIPYDTFIGEHGD